MSRSNLKMSVALLLAFAAGCGEPASDGAEESASAQELTQSGITSTLRIDNDWGAGYCATVALANGSSNAVTDWTVAVNSGGSTISDLWSGKYMQSGSTVTVKPEGSNALISPASSMSFGFCANGSGRPTVTSVSVVGGSGGTGGTTSTGRTTPSGIRAPEP